MTAAEGAVPAMAEEGAQQAPQKAPQQPTEEEGAKQAPQQTPEAEGVEYQRVEQEQVEQKRVEQEQVEQKRVEQEASSLVSGKLRQLPAPETTTMLPSLRGYSEKKKPP
jgi:hypothetical protein